LIQIWIKKSYLMCLSLLRTIRQIHRSTSSIVHSLFLEIDAGLRGLSSRTQRRVAKSYLKDLL